ncbi:MAG: TIGR04219 family outer membrane beta-barrel protein [Gammaproteobacteria bacterium]
MKFNGLITGCVLITVPAIVSADILSFAIGAGVWNETPEGNIIIPSNAVTPTVDVENNLFWSEESQGYIFATLEHPVPILPNVRVMYTKLDHTGAGSTAFAFDGESFSGTVANEFSIEQTDILGYYEVLDNVVSLDLGLNVRLLDLTYMINDDAGTSTSGSVSAPVPMLYGLIGGSPWPGVLLSAEGNYMSISGSTISDFNAKIAYTTSFFIGFEAGYRVQSIELDDVDDTNAKIDFNGPFLGAYLKF